MSSRDEPYYATAAATFERIARALNVSIANLYRNQGKYEEAASLYQRALAIQEKVLGPEHPHTAQTLNNLAALYRNQGKYEEAQSLYQRALAIYEKVLGPEHRSTKRVRKNYTDLLQKMGQKTEGADQQR